MRNPQGVIARVSLELTSGLSKSEEGPHISIFVGSARVAVVGKSRAVETLNVAESDLSVPSLPQSSLN